MTLADEFAKESRARVLTLDIETQRAQVEMFGPLYKPPFVAIDRVLRDARVLCFAAKWRGKKQIIFKSQWRDDDDEGYRAMLQAAHDLLYECDILVTYNGDRFDWQWLEREFTRVGIRKPLAYKSIDLYKVNKKWFSAGQLSMKLDWSARHMLHDRKVEHGGTDLWHDIRHGNKAQRRAAEKLMREYNIHDVEITENLFEDWLPYLPVNMALYENDDGLMHCTKCNSTKLRREAGKFHRTNAYAYQLYSCDSCGATSRGKRSKITTELRPV